MIESFGPWTTAASAGSKAHLSTFWKRRLAMLPATHCSRTRLGGRTVSLLLMTAALLWTLPTLRGAAAQTHGEAAAVQPQQNQEPSLQKPSGLTAAASENTRTPRQKAVEPPAKAGTRLVESLIAGTGRGESITVEEALVRPSIEIAVPAQRAGVVTTVKVAPGDKVKKGDMLAEVNDPQAETPGKILAPIEGEVVEVDLKEGEWADRGKTVARLIRLNQVKVEVFLDWNTFPPANVSGRKVELVVVHPGKLGETAFPGKVIYVSPLVEAGGGYLVRAVVENRQKDGFWLLAPGLRARLRILKEKTQ